MFSLFKGKPLISPVQNVGKWRGKEIQSKFSSNPSFSLSSHSFSPYSSYHSHPFLRLNKSNVKFFASSQSLREINGNEKNSVDLKENQINSKMTKRRKGGKGKWILLGLILGGSYFALRESEDPTNPMDSGEGGHVPPSKDEPISLYSEKMTTFFKRLPLGMVSYWWGKLTQVYIPESLREPIYGKFARMYHCNLDEMAAPLKSYQNFGEFFTRRLKDGIRKIDPAEVVSPADGRILHFGEIEEDSIEQVKGISYSMNSFFGQNIHQLRREHHATLSKNEKKRTKLYHCVIYLAPGDYHGFHSPTDWKITDRRYFPGHLFPVKPSVVSRLQGLFALNERVVLIGEWKHGFFSYTPVGATNVGSIKLPFDDVQTNQRPKLTEKHYDRKYSPLVNIKKGDNLGFFHMGSTIILIFESPDYEFAVSQGQKIKLGQKLGQVKQ